MDPAKTVDLSGDLKDLAESLSTFNDELKARDQAIGELLDLFNNTLANESAYLNLWRNSEARNGVREIVSNLHGGWNQARTTIEKKFELLRKMCLLSSKQITQAKIEGYEIV